MLKLLTKFKTQSLNEVKPYEKTASFAACGGDTTRSEVQEVEKNPLQIWPYDSSQIGDQKTTALLNTRPQKGELIKTLHWSGDITQTRTVYFKYDNKENGDFGHDLSTCSFKRHNDGAAASVAEKRKWSDMKKQRHFTKHIAGSGGDSSSSDDEIRELFTKQPKSDSLNTSRGIKVRPRRHRTSAEERLHRPSLDFEKMQQKVVWKKSCNSRPRIVKVRSYAGHSHHIPILMNEASIVSFQPIQTIKPYKMTPVEEPQALVY